LKSARPPQSYIKYLPFIKTEKLMQKEAFEPTGLIPRSIIRTLDRFRQQLLPGTEEIALQEYRISRYQILVSIKALCTLIFVPFLVTFTVKFFLITPVTEHFWDYQQGDIFLNSYQEKRAFNEMQDFSEKIFFESLVNSNKDKDDEEGWDAQTRGTQTLLEVDCLPEGEQALYSHAIPPGLVSRKRNPLWKDFKGKTSNTSGQFDNCAKRSQNQRPNSSGHERTSSKGDLTFATSTKASLSQEQTRRFGDQARFENSRVPQLSLDAKPALFEDADEASEHSKKIRAFSPTLRVPFGEREARDSFCAKKDLELEFSKKKEAVLDGRLLLTDQDEVNTLNLKTRFQTKSLEIAERYNKQSILAITCLLGDFVTLLTLYILFRLPRMKPQVIILKSFLTESLYSLSDTTKSFLLILGMDLLVGFHSPRGWEIILESALRHFGLPENESFILLFVALFPVFLDTVFKYWIFRYLNKISPSTVVTYHSMLE
jgi:hypothetical protein